MTVREAVDADLPAMVLHTADVDGDRVGLLATG